MAFVSADRAVAVFRDSVGGNHAFRIYGNVDCERAGYSVVRGYNFVVDACVVFRERNFGKHAVDIVDVIEVFKRICCNRFA